MAIYYLCKQNIGRGDGRAVVDAAAYRSGERIYDEYFGRTYNYTKRTDVIHKEILLSEDTPPEFADRSVLWNAVEIREGRHNSRTAHEFKIALPRELTHAQNIELMQEYIKEKFVKKGMCVDLAIHDKGDGNPHAHVMTTTRYVDRNGFGLKNRNWNKTSYLTSWRKAWADIANKHLERHGFKERIDHRTLIEQGINREPTIHEGLAVRQMKKRGIETDRGNENQAIIERNRKREEQERQREEQKQQHRRDKNRERGR